MSIQVSCPKCSGRLKMSKSPVRDRRVHCPRCGHRFVITADAVAAGPPPVAAKHQPVVAEGYRRPPLVNKTVGIGLAAAVLLVGIGIAAAIIFSTPSTTRVPTESIAERNPSDKTDYVSEKKSETKAEPEKKVEPAKQPEPEKKPDAEKKEPVNQEKNNEDFLVWMIKAGVAEESKRIEDAAAAYGAALKLVPEHAKAKQKLEEMQTLLAARASQTKEAEKLKEEVTQLLNQADKAMQAKQYAAAGEIYKLALQKMPADAAAGQGLIAAQEALTKDQAEQKKLADFQSYLAAGKSAMKSGRYADAIREFLAAQQLLPTNPEAAQWHRQAEAQLAAIQNQEELKKQYQKLIEQATASYRLGRFNDADAAYRQALLLTPNDPLATQGLAQAQQAAQAAQAEFQRYMNRGSQALADGRFQDAAAAFREAVRLSPGNESATRALRDAETAYENAVTYTQAIRIARASMRAMRYADAIVAFSQALKAVPNDPLAANGLLEARQNYDREAREKAQADQFVQNGLFNLKLQKYADAASAFSQALKSAPNHPQAGQIYQQASYADAMGKAQAALNAQRYEEAVQHYTAALQAVPGDFTANMALQRARALSRK